jgi:multiple sugar transport system permease protein
MRKMTIRKYKKWKGFLFVLPSFIGVMVFYIIPFAASFVYCFTSGIGERKFVGLMHFRELFQNEVYKLALRNTCTLIGISLPLLMLFSLAAAFLLEKKIKTLKWVQSILLIPMAIPSASLMMLWQDLFADKGIIGLLTGIQINWLKGAYAPIIIICMVIWKNIGYCTLLIVNALLMMPEEYEEAAKLDGAGFLKITAFIKLPYLVPSLFFSVVISLMNCFKIFREVYLLQGNYPEKNLYLLQHFMNNNFLKLNYERLSAAAFILYSMIFLFIFTVSKKQQKYIDQNF